MTIKYKKSITRALSEVLPDIVTPLLKSHGIKNPSLFYDWKRIVGEPLASLSRPYAITYKKFAVGGGTLRLMIDPSIALQFQHTQAQILDRINTYCGYRAIDNFIVKQEYLNLGPSSKEKELTVQEKERITQQLDHIKSIEVSKALQSFGEALIADSK